MDKTGVIKYDVNRIPDSNSSIYVVETYKDLNIDGEFVQINFDHFMQIMTNNILNNRKKLGNKIVFESGKKPKT